MIRVAIAEDHNMVRQGLRTVLEEDNEIQVVGEAADGREAVRLAQEQDPDVILMDVLMPCMNGIDALLKIASLKLRTRVIMLTGLTEQAISQFALRSGAKGYVRKEYAPAILLQAIRTVQRGEIFLPPDPPQSTSSERQTTPPDDNLFDKIARLTRRERPILALIAQGKTNKEIGDKLDRSHRTIEKHRASIKRKLGVKDTVSLMRLYMRYRAIFPDE